MAKKDSFVDTLKHGKCGGRKQLHNAFVHPDHCVNENAGRKSHICPNQEDFWVTTNDTCNCCKECENVCITVAFARNKEKDGFKKGGPFDDLVKKWKKYTVTSRGDSSSDEA
jgi:hypothetical protein